MDRSLQLKIITRLQDQLSGPLGRVRGAAAQSASGVKELRDRLKGLDESQKRVAEFRNLKRGLESTRTSLGQAQDRVRQLAHEMQSTAAPTAKMRQEFNAAVRTARTLGQQHEQQRLKLQQVRSALSDAGISTRNLSQSERTLRSDIATTNQQIDQQRQRLARLAEQTRKVGEARQQMERTQALAGRAAAAGAGASAVGYGILRGGASLLGEGMDFDQQMSQVQSLTRLDKDSDMLAALKEQARELGATTMFSATDAASGQAFLAMAGFTPEAIRAAMPGMLDVAKAGGMELAQAADVASNILTGFGLDASQMGRVGDVLTGAFTRSNTSLYMLGETMKYVGPNAASYGQGIEIMAAAAGKLGDAGIQGSMAGSAMRAILSRLAAPPKAAAEALEELGIQVEDARGNMRPLPDLLTEIHDKTKNLGNAARGGLLKAIAGEEAGSALTVLVDQAGSGALQEFIQTLRETEGEASATAKTMGDNLVGDLDEMSSAWSDIKITLMEVNRGAIRETVQSITGLIGVVGEWAKANPELVATLAKVVAIIGVVAAVFGGLSLTLAAILGPFAMVRYASTLLGIRLGGVFSLLRSAFPAVLTVVRTVGAAMMTNPIFIAVAAIAAIAYAVYSNWETIGPLLRQFWEGVTAPIITAWEAVQNFISTTWESIQSFFNSGIANIAATIINWSPLGLFQQVFAEVMSWFGVELPARFTDFGGMLMQGLVNGIKGMAGSVKESVLGVADSTVGWFKEKLGIQSPSRVFMGLGENVSEGAALGIERGQSLAAKATAGLSAMVAAIGLGSAPAWAQGIQNLPTPAFDNRPSIGAATAGRLGSGWGAPAGAQGPAVTIEGDTIHIHINAGGEAAQDIARAVRAELDRREREKAARTRSSLRDYGL